MVQIKQRFIFQNEKIKIKITISQKTKKFLILFFKFQAPTLTMSWTRATQTRRESSRWVVPPANWPILTHSSKYITTVMITALLVLRDASLGLSMLFLKDHLKVRIWICPYWLDLLTDQTVLHLSLTPINFFYPVLLY